MRHNALVSDIVLKRGNTWVDNILVVVGGAVLLAVLAQISIPLPFTPVPITGQTFGVAFLALLWGRSRGTSAFALYLGMGAAGLPVFSFGKSGLFWGPTTGYLLGMFFSSFVIGMLADRGWSKSFFKSWAACYLGSAVTFACGLFVLSLFVPLSGLLVAGLWPFMPGDFLKTGLAALLASKLTQAGSR